VIGKHQFGALLEQIASAEDWHVPAWLAYHTAAGGLLPLVLALISHCCNELQRAQSIKFHLGLSDVSFSKIHVKYLSMPQYDYFKWVYVVTSPCLPCCLWSFPQDCCGAKTGSV